LKIFKSVGFSDMDFIVGSVMVGPIMVGCIISFFALDYKSKNLENVCREMEDINRKHLGGIVYKGRGKILTS
jgi:hypothetical protein